MDSEDVKSASMEDEEFPQDMIAALLHGYVRERYIDCGPFDYGEYPYDIHPDMLQWGEKTYEDGRKYFGQFSSATEIAQGKGLCIGRDGSVCQGWYVKDSVSGRGRYIFNNGDVFQGLL